jgi:hypothetical protein
MTSKRATVPFHGYQVPLIGVPADAVIEQCDLCGDWFGLREVEWSGKQWLCAWCRRCNEDGLGIYKGGDEK